MEYQFKMHALVEVVVKVNGDADDEEGAIDLAWEDAERALHDVPMVAAVNPIDETRVTPEPAQPPKE